MTTPDAATHAETLDGRERLLAAARAEIAETGLAHLSLRSIARRAGVSHAAPTYHFGDRAGLLTAVAAEGFTALAVALDHASAEAGGPSLRVLGRTYVAFGLAEPALFDLMFRSGELHADDPALRAAQADSLALLSRTAPDAGAKVPGDIVSPLTLVSWAFAHGLVALTRDGALQALAQSADTGQLVDHLIDVLDQALSGTPTPPSTPAR